MYRNAIVLENACAYSKTGTIILISLKFTVFSIKLKKFKNEPSHTFVTNSTCVSLNLYEERKYSWKYGMVT
jgi:hypothetical protein